MIGWIKAGPPKSHFCFDHVNKLLQCLSATCYNQSNHTKVDAIPFSAFPRTQQAILQAYLHMSLFYAERQAGKL